MLARLVLLAESEGLREPDRGSVYLLPPTLMEVGSKAAGFSRRIEEEWIFLDGNGAEYWWVEPRQLWEDRGYKEIQALNNTHT